MMDIDVSSSSVSMVCSIFSETHLCPLKIHLEPSGPPYDTTGSQTRRLTRVDETVAEVSPRQVSFYLCSIEYHDLLHGSIIGSEEIT